ncbi:MAG: urease subunit beta [Betaproteobacteria bacterium]
MNLTPTELERLTVFSAAELARRHRSLGIKLSHPEAVALLTDEVMTAARRGLTHTQVVEHGRSLLSADDLEPGVASMIHVLAIEGCFAEGTKLVALFDPIAPGTATVQSEPTPGEIIPGGGEIEINAGRPRASVTVVNTGDRSIQVRSHAHFFEVNRALEFEREKAFGMRLDKASGTGVRFEPGVATTVELVQIGGSGLIRGFAELTEGSIHDDAVKAAALERARQGGYRGA